VLQIGATDARGVGYLRADAIAIREAAGKGWLPVTVERDGRTFAVRVELARSPLPYARIPVLLVTALVAVGVLLRGPASAEPRLFYLTFLLMCLQQTPFHGGPEIQTLASKISFIVLGAIAPALMVRWCAGFPPEARKPGAWARLLPSAFAASYGLLRGSYFIEGPLPATVATNLVRVTDGAFLVATLGLLTRGYRAANAVGRRRVKWALYGTYLGMVPVAVVDLALLPPALHSVLIAWALLPTVAMPLGFFVAVTRQQLFDVDRLISATAAYSVAGVLLFAGAFTLMPRLAQVSSEWLGLDPSLGQWLFALLLGGLILPAGRRFQPSIDRAFFPARHAIETEMPRLLVELASCETEEELVGRVGEDLSLLLEPESCVIHLRRNLGYAPLFLSGKAETGELDPQSPLVAVLATRKEPVVAGTTAGGRRRAKLAPFERAVLEELGVALDAPVRVADRLEALICLGVKRSGDLFTASEVGWIAAVADRMGAELQRMEAGRQLARGRELQDAYRAYVPGSLADQIEQGGALEEGEREVSVLFVDMRGYASFAERHQPSEIFSTVNRYTELVSGIVRERGGTVVEFAGDGLMAVFGAPQALERKERAAVRAGEEILLALDSFDEPGERITVGIGIATGSAFVGSVRAVDRRIWSALGRTTNLAARLQALTRELGVAAVIDAATWRAAGGLRARFERRQGIEIRGIAGPNDVFVRSLTGLQTGSEGAATGGRSESDEDPA